MAFPADVTSDCRTAIDATGQHGAVRVEWRSAVERDDLGEVSSWCAGVGPSVIRAQPLPATMPRPATTELTVVSWNMHVGGGDLRALVEALRRGDLTDGAPVTDFVVLIQEAFRRGETVPRVLPAKAAGAKGIMPTPSRGSREDIVDVSAALGLAVYYVPSMRNGDPIGNGPAEDRGNAIVSTLPLSEFVAIELPFGKQRRVAIAATIAADASRGRVRDVRVGSAHLDATAGAGRLWLFASGLRAKQARSLAASLVDPADDRPLVLGSDLNTWADGTREPAVGELRRVFQQTSAPDSTPTFSHGLRLDYLFFRLPAGASGDSERADDRFGSDHYPLIGTLRLTSAMN